MAMILACGQRRESCRITSMPSNSGMNMFMPEFDGIEVIRQLSRLWPQAKIIAMTGGAKIGDFTSSVAPAALQLGAQHMLLKPFTKQTLLTAISAVLNPQEGSETKSLNRDTGYSEAGCYEPT